MSNIIRILTRMPTLSQEEWQHTDPVSRWLILARGAVLVMTLSAALVAVLLAITGLELGALQLIAQGSGNGQPVPPAFAARYALLQAFQQQLLQLPLTVLVQGRARLVE